MKIPLILALAICATSHALVQIKVEADSGRKAISPYIYGKNDFIKNNTSDSVLTIFKNAGLHMMRSNGGNNSSKYNWTRHLWSSPDWYNNVYDANWDEFAQNIQTKVPELSGMFAFQLTGWAASNKDNNFDDWGYNKAQYWDGVNQNLAGGGVPNSGGGTVAASSGDPSKYLMPWPADSTAEILPHWFGVNGLGLDSNRFRYWNMDNEVEIWLGTHDDVYPKQPTAEEFIQKYKAVALAVRAHYPGIKLAAPASPGEWQWYTWGSSSLVNYKGHDYSWPEFLIKRLSEIQDSTGVRMLDVYDVHFYPGDMDSVNLMQEHRVWFDTTYEFPNSNGVRFAEGNWNATQKKEYYFERINRWLNQYFGSNHGIGLGVSESAISTPKLNTNLTTVWYASFLGTFADNGVELFTPWNWYVGQYEVMHLFSKKGHSTRILSRSSLDSLVSAYSSISKTNDSLTVILVNRDLNHSQDVTITLNGFTANDSYTKLQLSGLDTAETFVSESQNALVSSTIAFTGSNFSLTLPAKSVTALLFKASIPFSTQSYSNSISSSISMASSSSNASANITLKDDLRFLVRTLPQGLFIEGTVGSERIQLFDTRGHLQESYRSTNGSTVLDIKMHGPCILRIQKGNQVQWHLVHRL